MQRFADKVCLVTGAASGIGRATAQRLASEGAMLMLADINAEGLEETRASLPGGVRAEIAVFNATDDDSCRGMVAQTIETLGRLDVLCNIAGMSRSAKFLDLKREDWDRMFAVNTTSLFIITQAALPHLIQSGGNIVNMASASGRVGAPYFSHYAASKAAVISLTRSLAVEFSKEGVRVNCICPGGVNTPMAQVNADSMSADIDMDLLRRLFALHPEARPEEIAGAVAYLACDEARYVSGASFAIDGAQTA
ncbi:MAG: short-chain dehydrogenase [Haliea sp.]|nr:short-chain dehydrogenase [Haliea sp.]|tara:strand:- start:1800 stop:2552 length:753 start_codon:yes stop_codon:yes gene_type:complete